MNQRRLWRFVFVLCAIHLSLYAALTYLPVFIGWKNRTFDLPISVLQSSLYFAQFQLLGAFWAIARFDWRFKTFLFFVGVVALVFAHIVVPAALYSTSSVYFTTQLVWDVLLNDRVALVESIVLAILLSAVRMYSGDLATKPPSAPQQISIFSLLCITTYAAIAVTALKYFGVFTMESNYFAWVCMQLFIRALLAASCVWMVFAEKKQWIGIVCWAVAFSIATINPTPGVNDIGQWVYPAVLITQSLWLCSTFAVFRFAGYRLHKFNRSNAEFPISTPAA